MGRFYMGTTAELVTEILGDTANVSALRTAHVHIDLSRMTGAKIEQFQ